MTKLERTFTTNWFRSHAKSWDTWLDKYRGRDGVCALEIGSFEGASACWLADNILTGAGSTLVCVDPWQVGDDDPLAHKFNAAEKYYDANTQNHRDAGRIVKRKMTSEMFFMGDGLASVSTPFDFVYIDGDHNAHNALFDIVCAWRLIKPGGAMIVDDINWIMEGVTLPVDPAVAAFRACHTDIAEVAESRKQAYFRKAVQ